MEESIICPKCQHKNLLTSLICESCGYVFKSEDSKPENWLDSLRKTGELRELDSPANNVESYDLSPKGDSETIPDWLKRIHDLDLTSKGKSLEDINHSIGNYDGDEKEKNQIPHHDHEGKSDQNYEWLQNFRDYSDTVEKPEEKDALLNSDNSFNEEIEEELSVDQPLLSIEDIKENWQKEFPSLSDNVSGEDISPADDLPEWLNKDFGLDQPEPETKPTMEEIMSNDNQQTEKANEIPEWLKNNEESSRIDLEDNDEIDTSIPEWLRDIKSSKNNHEFEVIFENQKDEFKHGEYNDSELLFNKLELDMSDVDNSTDTQSSLELENGIKEELDQSELPSPVFIIEENDLPTEKPFLLDNDDSQFFRDSPLIDENYSKDEDLRIEDYQSLPSQESGLESSPFSFDGIPDWLEKVRLDELETDIEKYSADTEVDTPQIESTIDSTDTNDISQANLPEWLKAIRPLEVVTPNISRIKPSKRVEKAGPLAGLTGVLSTENLSNLYTSSKMAELNIDITEKQKLHAALLEEIISPINLQIVSSQKKSGEKSYQTIIIPVLFLILIVFSIFINQNIFRFPTEIPAETVRFHNLLTGYLNQNQSPENILLISELDASAYPEMNLISKSVIENLFSNNHRISSLTTNPTGIIISKSILENATQSVPTYNYAENVINLGYLPANHLGIQSFLANPRETILTDYEGNDIWTSTFLTNLNTITDFDLLILMTDNPDKSRLWIEQIKIFAPEVGFVVISTTQAIPLLKPYVDSNQIDGMIGGISGNLAFNNLLASKSADLERFAFLNQISVLIIIIFLLTGGLTTIVSNMKKMMENKKKQ